MLSRLLLAALFATSTMSVAVMGSGCQKVKMPHEMPGPPGCGKRDPNNTAPAMLSIAQQQTHKNQGKPDTLVDNDKGGKTWSYKRNRGSVFGQEVVIEVFGFDKDGLLYEQRTDLISKVGK